MLPLRDRERRLCFRGGQSPGQRRSGRARIRGLGAITRIFRRAARLAGQARTWARRRAISVSVPTRDPARGEVVEWLKAPASKAGERDERSESSNLSLSDFFR